MGLEDVHFTTGTAKDNVDFLVMRTTLSRYVAAQSYRGSATASQALKSMITAALVKPDRLTRPTFTTGIENADKDLAVTEYSIKRRSITRRTKRTSKKYQPVLSAEDVLFQASEIVSG